MVVWFLSLIKTHANKSLLINHNVTFAQESMKDILHMAFDENLTNVLQQAASVALLPGHFVVAQPFALADCYTIFFFHIF